MNNMRRIVLIAGMIGISASLPAHALDLLQQGKNLLNAAGGQSAAGELSLGDIAGGLKDALRVGTGNVVGRLGRSDGFNADPAVHIPLPQSLGAVQSALGRFGMGGLLDDLETRLNRAAEVATPRAKALFWQAISDMTLDDAKRIYSGPDDAATRYFQSRMSQPLAREMSPIVTQSLSVVGAVNAYDKAMGEYEKLPFVPDVRANLAQYVVEKGMDGIFLYLAREEAAIRRNPAKRTTDLLRKVFGAR